MVKRLILFSRPLEIVVREITPLLFPDTITQKVFAFMPSEGLQGSQKYIDEAQIWQILAKQYEAEFLLIDNTAQDVAAEREKLQRANILFITGGNTCVLLHNLRQSELDQAVKDFFAQEQYVYSGYSAGAMILTPSIEYEVVAFDPEANAETSLPDFAGLNILNYEILPHYIPEDDAIIEEYRKHRLYELKILTDDDWITVENE